MDNQEIFCTAANRARSLETRLAAVLEHFEENQERLLSLVPMQEKA